MNIKVVDVQRVFAESKPADAARKHLADVQGTLKKGLDDFVALYKDRVASPDAQRSIAQARNRLQQQMKVEQKAADAVVRKLLAEAINTWKATHDDVDMIISREQLIFYKREFDITGEILEIVDGLTPKFPELPRVNINRR